MHVHSRTLLLALVLLFITDMEHLWPLLKFYLFHYSILFIYLLAVLGLHCCMGFSLAVVSRGYSVFVVCGFLIVLASFIMDHGLYGARSSVLAAPQAPEHRLSNCGVWA